ncbi:MAG: hypothetical protein K2N64_04185 [Anaeroplasmataceae bacterium]|nr:hypothetical protein [Anaeroplasmataceae bacterium]
MKKIVVCCNLYPSKKELLHYLLTKVEGLYSENYDALIDALTYYKTPLQIEFKQLNSYKDKDNLEEILEIIHKENPIISFIKC